MKRPALATVADALTHPQAEERLAWYVNGTLDAPSIQRMEAHLAGCAACGERAAAERSLARLMREAPAVQLAPQAGLAAVLDRIDRREARRKLWRWPWRLASGEGALRPLVLIVGAQALVIVMLSTVLWVNRTPSAPTAYRVLSNPAAPVTEVPGLTRVRVVLDDALTLGELRALLEPWRCRIVSGPEGQGIYTLTVEGDAAAAVAELRRTRGVRFAEVVAGP